MRPSRYFLILSLAALSTPVLAQQPDPAQAFAEEWLSVIASDTISASSHKHAADLANKLVADYLHQIAELKKAKGDLVDSQSRLQWTLDNWVPKSP